MLKVALPAARRQSSPPKPEWELPSCRDGAQNLIESCIRSKDLNSGRRVHCSIISNGLDTASDLGDYLIRMFSSFGSLTDADLVFRRIPEPTSYSWQAIMSAHALLGDGQTTIDLFLSLRKQGLKPCKFICLTLLKAIGKLKCLPEARLAHSIVISNSLDCDVVVGSTLIDVYAKSGSIDEAFKVFTILPNACTVVDQGMWIHDHVVLSMLETNVVVGTALIDMYAKTQHVVEAQKAFDNLINPDLASWNAIIAGYTLQGEGFSAFKLFVKMLKQNVEPDKMTFSSVVKACACNGAIDFGRLVYNEIVGRRLEMDVIVGNSLIDMYAKCGCLSEAHKILTNLSNHDVVSWNVLISVYAQHGNYGLVHQCLRDMIKEKTKPDERTFLSILAACSHAGNIDKGSEYFISMVEDFGITHSDDHFNCMVDLLGRSGQLKDAESFLESMPVLPGGCAGWTSLLAACDKHSSMVVGRQFFDMLSLLDPVCGSGYVLMSNLFAGSDMGENALELQNICKSAGAWKLVGRTWIETNFNVNEFIAGDGNQGVMSCINSKLEKSTAFLAGWAHVPQLKLALETDSV